MPLYLFDRCHRTCVCVCMCTLYQVILICIYIIAIYRYQWWEISTNSCWPRNLYCVTELLSLMDRRSIILVMVHFLYASHHYPSDILHNYRRHQLGTYETRNHDIKIVSLISQRNSITVVYMRPFWPRYTVM